MHLFKATLLAFSLACVVWAEDKKYEPEQPSWPANPPAAWPTFHLAHPGQGNAMPGDPNPAYFYKGRYHLHYIYNSKHLGGHGWAHVSSTDMLHWQWHPTRLAPAVTGHGMYSGTGFFTKEGKAAMIYHAQGQNRNVIRYALDDNMEQWTEAESVIAKNVDGTVPKYRQWDPDCWRMRDTYYGLSGGRDPDYMKSTDLKNWTYMGKLLHKDFPKNLGVRRSEDVSCANMLKLTSAKSGISKWMLLCISHGLGCRYFLGDFKDEHYLPTSHGLMNWQRSGHDKNSAGRKIGIMSLCFAPESLLAEDGRRIMWAWLTHRNHPILSGTQTLPRELELADDGTLIMRPLRELQTLRTDKVQAQDIGVEAGTTKSLDQIKGDALEVELVYQAPTAKRFGLQLLTNDQGKDGLTIAVDTDAGTLVIDRFNLSHKAEAGRERYRLPIRPTFQLKPGEDLTLRVFIDKNIVEVFANNRQAAVVVHQDLANEKSGTFWKKEGLNEAPCHEAIRQDPNITLFSQGGDVQLKSVTAWKMKSVYTGSTVFGQPE